MPLAATPFQVVVNDMDAAGNSLCMSTLNYATGKFKVTGARNNLDKTQLWGQWGLSTNDPGMGGAVFHYPVTFNPFIALAGTTRLGTGGSMPANDAVITELGMTSCTIDSTLVEYTSTYRVVVIGRN